MSEQTKTMAQQVKPVSAEASKLAALKAAAKAATKGDWAQGKLLMTRPVSRWPADIQQEYRERESKLVFTGFSAADMGRGRQLVGTFRDPADAEYVALACPSVVLGLIAEIERLSLLAGEGRLEQ